MAEKLPVIIDNRGAMSLYALSDEADDRESIQQIEGGSPFATYLR